MTPQALTYSGRFLVYFNRHSDVPRVWCVAAPDRGWEIAAVTVDIRVPLTTHYEPAPQRRDRDGPPSAWFEGDGLVAVDEHGAAIITPHPARRCWPRRALRTRRAMPRTSCAAAAPAASPAAVSSPSPTCDHSSGPAASSAVSWVDARAAARSERASSSATPAAPASSSAAAPAPAKRRATGPAALSSSAAAPAPGRRPRQ